MYHVKNYESIQPIMLHQIIFHSYLIEKSFVGKKNFQGTTTALLKAMKYHTHYLNLAKAIRGRQCGYTLHR